MSAGEGRDEKLIELIREQIGRVDSEIDRLEDLLSLEEDDEMFAFLNTAECVIGLLAQHIIAPSPGDGEHMTAREVLTKVLESALSGDQ